MTDYKVLYDELKIKYEELKKENAFINIIKRATEVENEERMHDCAVLTAKLQVVKKENADLKKENANLVATILIVQRENLALTTSHQEMCKKNRKQTEQIAELQQAIRLIADKTLTNWSCIICLEHYEYYTPAVTCSSCGVYLCRGCSRAITNNDRIKCPSCRVVFSVNHAQELSVLRLNCRTQIRQINRLKKSVEDNRYLSGELEYYKACIYNGRRSWLFIDFARLAWIVMHSNYKLRPILQAKYKKLLLYFDYVAQRRILSSSNLLLVTSALKKRMPIFYSVKMLTI